MSNRSESPTIRDPSFSFESYSYRFPLRRSLHAHGRIEKWRMREVTNSGEVTFRIPCTCSIEYRQKLHLVVVPTSGNQTPARIPGSATKLPLYPLNWRIHDKQEDSRQSGHVSGAGCRGNPRRVLADDEIARRFRQHPPCAGSGGIEEGLCRSGSCPRRRDFG